MAKSHCASVPLTSWRYISNCGAAASHTVDAELSDEISDETVAERLDDDFSAVVLECGEIISCLDAVSPTP